MNKKKYLVSVVLFFIVSTTCAAETRLWQPLSPLAHRSSADSESDERFYQLDMVGLKQLLSRANMQGQSMISSEIELPVDGKLQRFALEQSPIMAPGLAAKFPEITTYRVHGLDDPHASGRLSLTPKGFHGMITSPRGTFYIDPESTHRYRAFNRKHSGSNTSFKCGVEGHNHHTPVGFSRRMASRTDGSLQVYRLAVAGTAEYINEVGPSPVQAQAEVVIAINRVNQIYERDLGVTLQLVTNNDVLLDANNHIVDYTNNNLSLMLTQNQTNIDALINPNTGDDNYDIGHVFGTGGGGIAQVGSVCTSSKAMGATGNNNPSGNIFYVDYVAHEIGHQFGADHTFNGTTGSCAGSNRVQETAFEPGSGSTIMGYAGLCDDISGSENIQNSSDAVFHAGSIEQINTFTSSGAGSTCGSVNAITNNPSQPVITPSADYTIPALTPFELTTAATDADGDTLSYSWDQMDAGTATVASTFGQDLGDNALFRSYLPQAQNTRSFPQLQNILSGSSNSAEVLPTTSRDFSTDPDLDPPDPPGINFRAMVRDGKSGIAADDISIAVDISGSAFEVTSHGSSQSFSGGATTQLNWKVGNTTVSPINCANVDIALMYLSSGNTSYCIEPVLTSTSNDGSESITLPDVMADRVRFKVSCSDNIFYAISSADLSITGASSASVDCIPVTPQDEEHDAASIKIDPDGDQLGKQKTSGGAINVADMLFFVMLFYFGRRRFLVVSD